MKKIKWAICDDTDCICFLYESNLKSSDKLEFVGSCGTARDLDALLRHKNPDVLLLDIQLESKTVGIDILPSLKESYPQLKIIMLTSYNDEDYIYSAFSNGADNYILKDDFSPEYIITKIVNTYSGNIQLDSQISKTLVNKTKHVEKGVKSLLYMFEIISRLSTTEYEILKEFYLGASYSDIAKKRFISDSTLRNHVAHILKKFNKKSMKTLLSDLKELAIFDYLG